MSTRSGRIGVKLTDKKREYDRKYYVKNREAILSRRKERDEADPLRKKEQRRRWNAKNKHKHKARIKLYADRRKRLIDMHGDRCDDCGKHFHPKVYDFHHRDPSQKEFALKSKNFGKSWEQIMVEASKCDLLCACCHRLRHIIIEENKYNDRAKKRTNGTGETTGPRKGTQATLPGI